MEIQKPRPFGPGFFCCPEYNEHIIFLITELILFIHVFEKGSHANKDLSDLLPVFGYLPNYWNWFQPQRLHSRTIGVMDSMGDAWQ